MPSMGDTGKFSLHLMNQLQMILASMEEIRKQVAEGKVSSAVLETSLTFIKGTIHQLGQSDTGAEVKLKELVDKLHILTAQVTKLEQHETTKKEGHASSINTTQVAIALLALIAAVLSAYGALK